MNDETQTPATTPVGAASALSAGLGSAVVELHDEVLDASHTPTRLFLLAEYWKREAVKNREDAERYRRFRAQRIGEYARDKGFWSRAIGNDTSKFDAAFDIGLPPPNLN